MVKAWVRKAWISRGRRRRCSGQAWALPSGVLRVRPLCGLNNIKELRFEWIVFQRWLTAAQGDYFDLQEFPPQCLGVERLKEALEAARIRGGRFDEVPVVDE